MEKKKHIRFLSLLIIVICISLCIGLTYAYFTDSATSSGNKIQAGKLKIDLEILDKGTFQWRSIKESQDPIFYHESWEPGYTDVKLLRVENEETLAIKWEARFIYESEFSALADAIKVYVKTSENEFAYPTSRDLDDSWVPQGTLAEFASNISNILNGELLSGESDYFGILLYMPAEVDDNDLQGQSIGPFDIQIVATQYTHESDAFGPDYDDVDTTPDPEPTDTAMFTWDVYDGYAVVTGLERGVSLTDVVMPNIYNGLPVIEIASESFYKAPFETLTILKGITTIGTDAFSYCASLTGVTIQNGVTTIGGYSFSHCTKLAYISIPASVTAIDMSAFYNCSSLNSICFEGSVEQWNAIAKGNNWNYKVPATEVVCTDGSVTLN